MLEQREKVCKVCKAADNRGLLPSRSAEHGLVPEVLSPVMTLAKTKNGLTIQECHNGINIAKGKGGEDQISKKILVKYILQKFASISGQKPVIILYLKQHVSCRNGWEINCTWKTSTKLMKPMSFMSCDFKACRSQMAELHVSGICGKSKCTVSFSGVILVQLREQRTNECHGQAAPK